MIAKGFSKLETARIDYKNKKYVDATSRAYYAVYHLIAAVLESKDLRYSSHNQTVGAFNKEFIKTGVFPKNYTSMIQELFDARQEGDYSIVSDIDKDDAKEYIKNAELIFKTLSVYLKNNFIESDLFN